MEMHFDLTPVDTLTVKFCRDMPGPEYQGPDPGRWIAYVGPDIVEGSGGYGLTPRAALEDLAKNLGMDEGWRSDNGKLFLR